MARLEDDDDRDLDEEEDRGDDDDDQPRKKKKNGPSAEEKQMGMFCHIGILLGGFIIPLIIWMMKKEDSRFVDRQGKEALNFAISLMIYTMVTCCVGYLVLGPLSIYFCIMAGLAANRGEYYTYPMTIRFIK